MKAYQEGIANETVNNSVNKPTANVKEPTPITNPDYQVLAGKYGDLESLKGKTINLELHEAARLLNRSRVKVDAFYSLKKNLKNDYDINFNIYSRRAGK